MCLYLFCVENVKHAVCKIPSTYKLCKPLTKILTHSHKKIKLKSIMFLSDH